MGPESSSSHVGLHNSRVATTAIGDSPSRGNLGRRDNTSINAIPHETRNFRGPTDKDCGLFKEDTSVLGHWPQSRLGQSKRRCLQKAENKESRQRATRAQSLSAQRARRYSLRPFLRAQVSALQERYNRENSEESEKHSTQTACLFTPQTQPKCQKLAPRGAWLRHKSC